MLASVGQLEAASTDFRAVSGEGEARTLTANAHTVADWIDTSTKAIRTALTSDDPKMLATENDDLTETSKADKTMLLEFNRLDSKYPAGGGQ